jgi:hypothetical protein
MTRYRTRTPDPSPKITARAVELFKADDMLGLHRELGLKVWELSPLWVEVGQECGYSPTSGGAICWDKIMDLRQRLEEAAK